MKRKWLAIGSSLVIMTAITSGLAASVAWFVAEKNSFKADVDGSVVEEYFHCGKGTQADPFVITRPIHFYHLVEFFQRKTVLPVSGGSSVTFGTDYLYFQVGYNLDDNASNGLEVYTYNNDGSWAETYGKTLNMAYFSGDNALMPIGTSECPFFGSFNGGGNVDPTKSVIIENFNIKSSEEVVVHGGGSTKTTRYTSDVGMFGYVADDDSPTLTNTYNTTIHDVYVNNLTIDTTGAVKGKNAANASGVPHETAHDNDVHVGYIAGHIHTYTTVGYNSAATSKPLYDIYVNNAKITGGYSGAKCNFGYVGYADTIDGVTGSTIDLTEIVNDLDEAAGGGSQGDDWGGSVDMRNLNVRLYNHLNDTTHASYSTNGYYGKYESTYSKISVVRGDKASTYYKKNPLTQQVFYNLMGNGNHTYQENYTLPGTYIPLLENDDGTVPDKNTGYIVSDSQAMNNVNGTVRSASYQTRYIANSLVGTNATDVNVHSGTGSASSVSFNSNNLEILTNKGTTYSKNNFYLIKDSYNANHNVTNTAISGYTKSDATTPESLGLKKYADSREALDSVLSGQSFIHGIHFMGTAISTSKTISIPTAIINGNTKTSYVVPKSCIDFNLKEEGYINFFGGSYYARTKSEGSYADSFFSLNYITRNAQDGISSIKQINEVYTNSNTAEGQPKYVYKYSDNSYSTGTRGTLIFNMNFIMNEPPAHNALYYFEIPVNAGEYALGTVSNKNGGGYLMYLDIGTAGSDEQSSYDTDYKISEDAIFTQMEYLTEGHVINSCFNIGFVIPSDSTKNNFYVMVTRNGTVFDLTIVNTTTHDFTICVLLVDNNDDPDDIYPYTYTITYNGGTKSEAQKSSEIWVGTSGGSAMSKQT